MDESETEDLGMARKRLEAGGLSPSRGFYATFDDIPGF